MALLDAYATVADYQARNSGGVAVSNPSLLGEYLVASSRLLDRELGLHDGAFNSHVATYTFDAHGGSVLYLRDRASGGYFLQSIPSGGIGIDTEVDGTYDGEALSLGGAVRGLPENAAPSTALELLPFGSRTSWPDRVASVRIAGATWGWAAVPEMVREIVVSMVRDLSDHHGGGAAAQYQRMDDLMPLSDQTWRLIRSAKQRYSRRLPVVA